MRDPGSLTLPCQFGNVVTVQALADLGASSNLIPYSFYSKIYLLETKPIWIEIHLVEKTMALPRGIVEDLLVKVNKSIFSADFILLNMEKDTKCQSYSEYHP